MQNNTFEEKTIIEKLLDLKEAFKKKKAFTDDEYPVNTNLIYILIQQLKNIIKELPFFKDLQPQFRIDILSFFDVFEYKPNEIILKKDGNASIYILVEGKIKRSKYAPWHKDKVRNVVEQWVQEEEDKLELDLISQKQLFQEWQGLKICGNLQLLSTDKFLESQQQWDPCYIYSLTNSVVFQLNYEKTHKYMMKLVNSIKTQEKINFLQKTVPVLQNLVSSLREKALSLFTQVNFIPNHVLIQEDTLPQYAYIIIEGHCALESKQIPIRQQLMDQDKRRAQYFMTLNKGYFSKTMNSYQIGLISEDQWIGEELVLKVHQEKQYQQLVLQHTMTSLQNSPKRNKSPDEEDEEELEVSFHKKNTKSELPKPTYGFNYSVIAKTNVKAYAISKEDLINNLPKDIYLAIVKQAERKQQWIEKRYQEIKTDINKLYNMENQYHNYIENAKEVVKLFPQASKQTLKTINEKSVGQPKKQETHIDQKDIVNLKLFQFLEQIERNYRKGMFTSQTMGFADLKKVQSHNQLNILKSNPYESPARKSLNDEKESLSLPQITETLSKLVTHSELQLFHKNPFEASKSPTDQQFTLKNSITEKYLPLSISDKIAQSFSQLETIENHNMMSPSVSNQEKIHLDTAAYVKSNNRKMFLPKLVRNIETDKSLKIAFRNNNIRNSVDQTTSNNKYFKGYDNLTSLRGKEQKGYNLLMGERKSVH